MDINEVLKSIEVCETPFQLRRIYSKYFDLLRIDLLIDKYKKKLDNLEQFYTEYQPDTFLYKCLKSLRFDFEAEIIEGKHETPPPTPIIIKEVIKVKIKPEPEFYPDEKIREDKISVKWPNPPPPNLLKEVEFTLIMDVLRETKNNRTQAAKILGVSIRTIRNKLYSYEKCGMIKRGKNISRVHREFRDEWGNDVHFTDKDHANIEEIHKPQKKAIKALSNLVPKKASCCPAKLEWMQGLCLKHYKEKKDGIF